MALRSIRRRSARHGFFPVLTSAVITKTFQRDKGLTNPRPG